MISKKFFLSLIVFFSFAFVVSAANNKKASFKGNAVTVKTQTSISFFIPEELKSAYIYVSDESKNIFQKFKIYQRGEGKIIIDRDNLAAGTYFYTMYVDGEAVDTQKLIVSD